MTTTNGCAACASQPFQIFFVLAAGTAAAGVQPWLIGSWPVGMTAAVWHREMLLFGMVPGVLAGFLLTALPRWTRSPPVPQRVVRVLMALWLAGRLVHLWSPGMAAPIAASFILSVAMLVAVRVVKAGAMREIKVVFLLILLAMAAAAPDVMPADFRLRLALAAILGLIAVIGGRIAPALTASYSALRGAQFARQLPHSAEVAAALSLIIAIGLWCFDADGQGPASLAAAVLQAARLLAWRPWRVTGQPGLVAIHLAYAWIPLGLGLNVLRSAGLGVSDNAVLHAWAAGAIGAMCLAVMASMARRQSRQAFSRPAGSLAMFFAGVGAAPLRLLAELGMPFQLQLAALCWSSAFLLFVASYRRYLGLAR
ncbi:MAG: NnrS family protein [Bosea sp. (in: a-proteobacteria)]|uniref:NnrS family protein n=1 Tax=Bosea sp. (in: a-proteobacteria) TaxID=1871050 RepID=UPI003F7BCBE4